MMSRALAKGLKVQEVDSSKVCHLTHLTVDVGSQLKT